MITAIAITAVAGDYFLKLASAFDRPLATKSFSLGCTCYFISAIAWVYALKFFKLSTIGAAYSAIVILLLFAIGAFVFREKITSMEFLGVIFAICSVLFIHFGS